MRLAEATRLPLLIFRLPHFQYRFNESGTKAAILPFDTVTSATISMDTMYDLRLAQPNRKNKAREARRFLRLYILRSIIYGILVWPYQNPYDILVHWNTSQHFETHKYIIVWHFSMAILKPVRYTGHHSILKPMLYWLLPSMKCIRALFSVCLAFFFIKLQSELVRVTRETSRYRHIHHLSRRGLAQIDRLRAGDRYSLVVVFVRQMSTKFHPAQILVIAKIRVTNVNNHHYINI